MDIFELTLEQIRDLKNLFGGEKAKAESYLKTGTNVFIRTVTHAHTGNVVAITDSEIVLKNAAWIADTGRFMNALQTCNFDEVEPFPSGSNVIINRSAVVDICEIKKLPTDQK